MISDNRMSDNIKPGRKWLIISYRAGNHGVPCSNHIDDRLPFLQKLGVRPIVLCSPCKTSKAKDCYRFRYFRVPSAAPSGMIYEVRYWSEHACCHPVFRKVARKLAMLFLLPLYHVELLVIKADLTWSWSISASLAAIILMLIHRPSTIYSTGGPSCAHLAAMLCSRLFRKPWIAELQEPLVYPSLEPHYNLQFNSRLERWIARYATGLVQITKSAEEDFQKRNTSSCLVRTIYPGAADDVPIPVVKRYSDSQLVFLNAGSLEGRRNLETFLEGVTAFIKNRSDVSKDIKIVHCGVIVGREIKEKLDMYGSFIDIDILGQVTRDDCRKLLHSADVLLIVQHADLIGRLTIPSKTYEYFNINKPILALTYQNPEMDELIRMHNHTAVPCDDIAAISAEIERIYDKWKAGNLKVTGSKACYNPYTASRELIDFADACKPAGSPAT